MEEEAGDRQCASPLIAVWGCVDHDTGRAVARLQIVYDVAVKHLTAVLVCMPDSEEGRQVGGKEAGVPLTEVWVIEDAEEALVDLYIHKQQPT